MDLLQILGTALGLGALSGLRLYLTVFLLGLAHRLEWLPLEGRLAGLQIVADERVMWAAGVAMTFEFLADKVPWVDSVWDALHTFIRPVGAAFLGSAAAAELTPEWRLVIALLAGGVALGGHSSKAATRLAVNHSPEPFSNVALSVMGDLAVPAGVWFTVRYPEIALVLALLFVALLLWLGPKAFRALKLEVIVLAALIAKWFGGEIREPEMAPEDLRVAASNQGTPVLRGWRCAATSSVKGLARSVGYLCQNQTHYVFVTRRMLRRRVHFIERRLVRSVTYKPGFLMATLTLETAEGPQRFDLLPGTAKDIAERLRPAVTAQN
jgi:hypothetical protein